ncbi:peptidase family M48-domain-containing protein [Phellopilus nigrolimitatus]|nr:peptidase family M48-domain-containing protein [Phellopilus nigrolimitatus]
MASAPRSLLRLSVSTSSRTSSMATCSLSNSRLRLPHPGRLTFISLNPRVSGSGSLLGTRAVTTHSWRPQCKASKRPVPVGSVSVHHHRTWRPFGSSRLTRINKRDSRAGSDQADGTKPLDARMILIAIAVVGGGAYYVTHLEKVPETGRWRFMSVSPRVEAALAKDEHKEFLNEYKGRILPASHPVTLEVRKVVSAILEANNLGTLKGDVFERPNAGPGMEDVWDPDGSSAQFKEDETASGSTREWTLIVVNDNKTVNAAAGHGNIIVFTGILPVARDEQGLAAVLSHVARHISERLSSLLVLNFVLYTLGALGLDPGFGSLILKYLYTLPNSRTQELEADKIGLKLAAHACFDPRAAPAMQKRLLDAEKSSGARRLNVSFLYTHPTGEQRVELLTNALPEAYALRAASGTCASLQDDFDAFRETVDSVRGRQNSH